MSEIDTFHRSRTARDSAIPAAAMFPAAERLVGVGFRCWLQGFQTSDIGCWEVAWDEFSRAVGPQAAKPLMTELACWVRAVQDSAERRIEVFPAQCRRFCRDECLAISMVAACQHSTCPDEVEEAIEGADNFARCLREAGQVLSPGTAFMGAGLVMPAPRNLC